MKKLCTTLLMALPLLSWAQEIGGDWHGTLDIQGTKLRLVLHIEQQSDGLTATLDSPDQGATGLPVDEVAFANDTLRVKASNMGLTYVGTYDAEAEKIDGTFQQGALQLPLALQRLAQEKPTRPQDPTDFPYLVEKVQFTNEADDVTLAGTLTLPKGDAPEAVLILVSGSGPQDRNEEVPQFNHRPFLVLSDFLTRQGIGVLRYDDRGVGESTGDRSVATIDNFAKDAAAAVDFLRKQDKLAAAKIGIAGHSEGGMIAPMLADEVDFLVLLAAPGVPIDELLLLQSRKLSQFSGVPETIYEANQKLLSDAYNFIKDNPQLSQSELQAGLEQIFIKGLSNFPEPVRASIGDPEAFAKKEAEPITSPWFTHFVRFEPSDYLENVQIPTLALNGTLDLQVPAEENLAAIERSLEKAGNDRFEIVRLEGLNHLFQTAETGSVQEYAQIEETFNPTAMQTIADWINNL